MRPAAPRSPPFVITSTARFATFFACPDGGAEGGANTSADGSAVAADIDWAGTRWGAGKGSEPTTVARHQSATLSMLSCLDRLALQSNSQATARQKEIRQRDPNRFNGAYFRGCKLVFACAIKWLAPVEDVARLFGELGFCRLPSAA